MSYAKKIVITLIIAVLVGLALSFTFRNTEGFGPIILILFVEFGFLLYICYLLYKQAKEKEEKTPYYLR